MKKLFLILAFTTLTSVLFATHLIVIKRGGKELEDGSIGYRRVQHNYNNQGELMYLKCTGRGVQSCPPVGIVFIGQTIGGMSLEKITANTEQVIREALNTGSTTGRISYGTLLVHWKAAALVGDELEYVMTITD